MIICQNCWIIKLSIINILYRHKSKFFFIICYLKFFIFSHYDVEKFPYPLDIVVNNIRTVVSNQSTDSSDDEDLQTAKEINYVLQLQGFKVFEKGKFIVISLFNQFL